MMRLFIFLDKDPRIDQYCEQPTLSVTVPNSLDRPHSSSALSALSASDEFLNGDGLHFGWHAQQRNRAGVLDGAVSSKVRISSAARVPVGRVAR